MAADNKLNKIEQYVCNPEEEKSSEGRAQNEPVCLWLLVKFLASTLLSCKYVD